MESSLEHTQGNSFIQRVTLIRGVITVMVIALLVRAFYLQTVQRLELEAMADRQHSQTMLREKRRGTIYDREHNILAVSLPMDSLFAL